MKFFKNLLNSLGLFFHNHFFPSIMLLFAVICSGVVYIPLTFLVRDSSLLKNVPFPTLICLEILFLILVIILGIGTYKANSKRNPKVLFQVRFREASREIGYLPTKHATTFEIDLLWYLANKAQTMDDITKLFEEIKILKELLNLREELRRLEDQRNMINKLPELIEKTEKQIAEIENRPK